MAALNARFMIIPPYLDRRSNLHPYRGPANATRDIPRLTMEGGLPVPDRRIRTESRGYVRPKGILLPPGAEPECCIKTTDRAHSHARDKPRQTAAGLQDVEGRGSFLPRPFSLSPFPARSDQ
jgi:hypothetical protein